jgi:dipeptidyl aminopeptidase/acylaminoacyl peptidase
LKKRKIEIKDLFDLKLASDPVISPDGNKIVFNIKTVGKDRTTYYSNLYLYDIKTSELLQFTVGDYKDRAPKWTQDGKSISFISDRGEECQFWTIPLTGGEARKLTKLEEGSISEYTYSPCGKKIAFIFSPKKKRELNEYVTDEIIKADKKNKDRILCRVITRLRYKADGGGYVEDERNHVYVLDLLTCEVKQVTFGEYDDSNPVFFPDGKKILFVTNRTENPDLNSFHSDLFTVSIDGGEACKLDTPAGPLFSPIISNDGRKIVYLGHDRPDDAWGVTNTHLWMLDLKSNKCKNLMPKFDRTCTNVTVGDIRSSSGISKPVFSEDENFVYFQASDRGNCRIFKVDVMTGKVDTVTDMDGEVVSFTFSDDRKHAAFLFSDIKSPGDIWLFDNSVKKQNFKRLTNLNDALLDNLDLTLPEKISFPSKDGFMVDGWIMKPVDFKPTKKYPLILQIHGGPRCQYANAFFFEFNLLAAAGYVVLYTNPRGGQGYGTEFAATIINDWGSVDYQDLMSAVDFMTEKKYVDSKRLGVAGGSYGGYMTNWIVGHTDRFKAAVTQRSVANLMSMFGTCDFGYDIPREFGGSPWHKLDELLRMSPITYVKNINTPLLIIHSELDLRTCIEQGEQLFVALKVLGKEVVLVRFPDECHELSRSGSPDRRAKNLECIVKWFDDHLK